MSELRNMQTPDWAILVGEYSIERLLELEIVSSRLQPLDTCRLVVDNSDGRADVLAEGDVVSVGIGDRSTGLAPVFHGEVERREAGGRLVLEARDVMLALLRHEVTMQWLRVRPQDVARQLLRQVGLEGTLGTAELAPRHAVVGRGQSGMKLLQEMDRNWGLGWDLYCEADGRVFWGPWSESPRARLSAELELPIFVHGESLLELEPAEEGGVGRAKTWLTPSVAHSAFVGLQDDRLWKRQVLARVDTVTHRIGASGAFTTFDWSVQAAA